MADRREPIALRRLLRCRTDPLAWALPDGEGLSATRLLLSQLAPMACRRGPIPPRLGQSVGRWLVEAADHRPTAGRALESLAWSHSLPRAAASLSPKAWWALLEHLLRTAAEAEDLNQDEDPHAQQLLAGELPLTLAYLFPEITACRKLMSRARGRLSRALIDLLDGEGVLHAKYFGALRPLLACWTRCAAIGSQLPKGCWSERAQGQYQWLIRQAMRLTRSDGTHVLCAGSAGARCDGLFAAALRLGGDRCDRRIAAVVLPPGRKTQRRMPHDFPAPAEHAEWAHAAVLRARWRPDAPRLTVLFPDETFQMELESEGRVIWSGPLHTQIHCDGRLAEPLSSWSDVCWISNEHVDYLELELPLTGPLRIQRHMVLARRDGFLFLADAVLGRRAARLDYRIRLPLADGVCFHGAAESREGFLTDGKRRALVLPLGLPEWRADPRGGTLAQVGRAMELAQSAEARSLFAPLWFDLAPQRLRSRWTWRQLTVAENLAAVPSDVAVGHRVMVGRAQWLVYRSLARPANRTVLGHNLITETLLARFVSGEVEPLVEIE